MKKLTFSISLILIALSSSGQWDYHDNYDLNFEPESPMFHLSVDTKANTNNIWQVGKPQKTFFTSAYSPINVIVTDTVNPYPINDTSIFIIKNVASGRGFEMPHTVILAGQYCVNSDTLSDFGKIEFSSDLGTSWIDLLNNPNYSDNIWLEPKPILTGNSIGWQRFVASLAFLGPIFNIHDGDTILYRFTFISDGVQTNKDGLMFDDLHFEDWIEGIPRIQNDNLISIYPNPVTEKLTIISTNSSGNETLQIINYIGQVVYVNHYYNGEPVDTKIFSNGIYFLKYSTSKSFSIKKFVVNHD